MHSAVRRCTSNMILQLIMQPVIICFLKVEDCVKKIAMNASVFHKNALVFLLSNGSSRLACWASMGESQQLQEPPG